MLTEKISGADTFKFKKLKVIHQFIYQLAKLDYILAMIGTVYFIKKIIIKGIICHCYSPLS